MNIPRDPDSTFDPAFHRINELAPSGLEAWLQAMMAEQIRDEFGTDHRP